MRRMDLSSTGPPQAYSSSFDGGVVLPTSARTLCTRPPIDYVLSLSCLKGIPVIADVSAGVPRASKIFIVGAARTC